MTLYQKMRLLHGHEDHPPPASPDSGPNKAAGHDISLAASRVEFAIKAVQQAATGQGAARSPPMVRISVSAGSMATLHHSRAAATAAAILRTSSWQAGGGKEASARAAQFRDSAALSPLPGYCSMAQFGPTTELYRSTQSCVLRASCLAGRGQVIIKRYTKGKMSSRAAHKMHREIQLMYRLRGQEGVAQILGDFEDGQYFYIAMEFYEGGDLYKRSLKQAKEMPLEEHWICTKVIVPLLRVLCVLHDRHGIVHRDIKPENIFLTDTDELRLGDLGLAIQQQQELPFLRAGTLDYMSPEVLCNPLSSRLDESRHYTAADLRRIGFAPYNEKVDVWAVGVLVYELMSGGATPFFHDEPETTQKLIMRCDLASVRFERHQLLSPWADFVRTALQREPGSRPSAAQLLQHRWVQQHLQARPRPPLAPPRRPSLSRVASLPAMALFKAAAAAAVYSPPDPPALAPAAEQAPTPCPAPAPAGKALPVGGGSGNSSCDASVLAPFPSTGTSSSGSGINSSSSLSSFASLHSLAEAAVAAAACGAPPPPPPVTTTADLCMLRSSTSCLTLTAQSGCRCSTCRLGLGSSCLECGGSGSGDGAGGGGGCSGEDSEMPLAAAELSGADPGSFASQAPEVQEPGAAGESSPGHQGAGPPLGPLWPSPFASQPPAPRVLSLPCLLSQDQAGGVAAEPLQARPQVPSPLGPPPQRPQPSRASCGSLGWAPPLDGAGGSVAGGGGGGDVRLSRAGHRNRVVAYMQKQRISLLKTLRITRRSVGGSGGSADSARSRSGGSTGAASSSEDGCQRHASW